MYRATGMAEDRAAYMPRKILKIDEEEFGDTEVQWIYIDDDDMPQVRPGALRPRRLHDLVGQGLSQRPSPRRYRRS